MNRLSIQLGLIAALVGLSLAMDISRLDRPKAIACETGSDSGDQSAPAPKSPS